ncbi:hypothetical protein VitviT2T_010135 [Vitis vinifera]|uniref:Uncharacterized protein n=1 Tax=Vitis vinifera TaxID=29760 RepID=A0ABY9C7G7_VITVI|nr:hypothetical protein VitviT2T_010135 [Vitis vinifera]
MHGMIDMERASERKGDGKENGYHGGVNNERNGLVDIEKVVEKWSGFLRHGDMGMVAKDDKWGERPKSMRTARIFIGLLRPITLLPNSMVQFSAVEAEAKRVAIYWRIDSSVTLPACLPQTEPRLLICPWDI